MWDGECLKGPWATHEALFFSPLLCMWKHKKQSNRQKHDTLHRRSLTLLGSFWKWEVLRAMWRDRINPHEISLSNNVYAQITIKVESLTSFPVYKAGLGRQYLSAAVSLYICKRSNMFFSLWNWQSELWWTGNVTTASNSVRKLVCRRIWKQQEL